MRSRRPAADGAVTDGRDATLLGMSIRHALTAVGLASFACRPNPTDVVRPTPTHADTPHEDPPSPIGQGTAWVVRPGATVWLDSAATQPLRLPADPASVGLAVRVVDGSGERIEIETDADASCPQQPLRDLRLRMFVARADLIGPVPCGEPSQPSLPNAGQGLATHAVRAGAVVHWRDGTDAGVVARDHLVRGQASVAGAMTCLPYAIAPGDEVTLCVPSDAVFARGAPTPAPAPASDNSLRGRDDDDAIGGLAGIGSAADNSIGDTIGLRSLGTIGEKPTATVRHGNARVVGPLDREIVRRIVRRHTNEIRHCYAVTLLGNAEAKGRASISFTIDVEGNVRDARVEKTTLKDEALRQCIVEVASGWRFPKPSGGGEVQVSYPFTFDPG